MSIVPTALRATRTNSTANIIANKKLTVGGEVVDASKITPR